MSTSPPYLGLAVCVAARTPLMAPANSDGEIAANIELLKANLDALKAPMKAARKRRAEIDF